MARGARWLLALVGLGAACREPELTEANSAQAALSCLDLVRRHTGDPEASLPDENQPSLQSQTLVRGEYLVRGELVSFDCRFEFDRDTQRYRALEVGPSAS